MLKSPRLAIRYSYAIIAISVGLWVFRLADFRDGLGLTNSQLSIMLLCAPITAMIVLTQSPRLSQVFGLVNLIRFGISLSAISVLILSFGSTIIIASIGLVLFGIASAMFEIGLNTVAQKIDRDTGSIISSCHGFWSIGFGIGGWLAGTLSDHGLSFRTQELFFVPLIVMSIFLLSKPLPHPQASHDDGQKSSWPSLQILPICLVPFAGLFIEGATADWNTIFLRDTHAWRDADIGFALGAFMFAMAIARLFGDYLRSRYSAKSLITFSTFLSILGLILYAGTSQSVLILLGCILGGLGAGNVYPLALVIANNGKHEGEASQINGSIALVSFNAFLIAPVFMGWMGDAFGMQMAFLLLLPLFASTFLWLKLAKV